MKHRFWLWLMVMAAAVLMLGNCMSVLAAAPDMEHSYCNPLNLDFVDVRPGKTKLEKKAPSISGTGAMNMLAKENWDEADGRCMMGFGGGQTIQENSFRTTADVFVYQISDGTYVMHASGGMNDNNKYGACWTSKDYINWEYHEMNMGVTAPTFVELNGRYYLCGNASDVLVSDEPWGPWESLGKFKMPDGSEQGFADVNFFLDDDGRLYMSYSIGSPIMACELDAADPTVVLSEPVIIWRNDGRNWWERMGTGMANSVGAYTEGSQIFKYNGVYYLQVSSNGTESLSYNMSVKKSTEGPLSGWTYQQHNPVAFNMSNFIPGAGHGCFTVDQDNNLVCFYTQCISYEDGFERRVGMDICWLDENGDIHVNITDTPQLAPDLVTDPADASGDLGLARLCTVGGSYWASSYDDGRNPVYAIDNNVFTWWEPDDDDEQPVFHAGLSGIYDVYAVQLNWKELGKFSRDNVVRYRLEYFDLDANDWAVLSDNSDSDIARAVEYITIPEGVRTIALRLTILGTTDGKKAGVTGFRIFGENYTMAQEHHRWDEYDPLP